MSIGLLRRLLFASIGLAAGNAALLIFLLCNALRVRGFLLKAHMGEPHLVLPQAWQMFFLYTTFSVIGWILVGVPIAVAFPARLLLRATWPVLIAIGAALGPLALLLIFFGLFAMQGRLGDFSLRHTQSLWPLSVLISTVSFLAYAGLLRRFSGRAHHIRPGRE